MAKTQLTPEQKAAQAAAKAEQAAKKSAEAAAQEAENSGKASGLNEKLKEAFKNYPTAERLYVDGEGELFFYQVKEKMTVVKRADFFTETTND